VDQVGERVVWHRIGDDGLHGRVFVFLSVVSYFQDTGILPLVVFFSLSLSRSDGIFGPLSVWLQRNSAKRGLCYRDRKKANR
jgi:hypothetical protein